MKLKIIGTRNSTCMSSPSSAFASASALSLCLWDLLGLCSGESKSDVATGVEGCCSSWTVDVSEGRGIAGGQGFANARVCLFLNGTIAKCSAPTNTCGVFFNSRKVVWGGSLCGGSSPPNADCAGLSSPEESAMEQRTSVHKSQSTMQSYQTIRLSHWKLTIYCIDSHDVSLSVALRRKNTCKHGIKKQISKLLSRIACIIVALVHWTVLQW